MKMDTTTKMIEESSQFIARVPQWARRSDLVEHEIPAVSIMEGDVYQTYWRVTLASRVLSSDPPVVLLKLEDERGQQQMEILEIDDRVVIRRFPEGSLRRDEVSTTRPLSPHNWERVAIRRGLDGSYADWICTKCARRFRVYETLDQEPDVDLCQSLPETISDET